MTALGKRKRPPKARPQDTSADSDNGGSDSSELDAQEIFRRHFEAQFEPLHIDRKATYSENDVAQEDMDDESEWEGISEVIVEQSVEVVQHSDSGAQLGTTAMSREELKTFMVC